jgi:hypothetical protein
VMDQLRAEFLWSFVMRELMTLLNYQNHPRPIWPNAGNEHPFQEQKRG